MDLAAALLLYGELHEHDRGKQGKHHGCCRCGGRALVAWHLLGMFTKIHADLPLNHRIHPQADYGEHGQGGNPFWFLQPYGANRGRVFDPAKAGCSRRVLLRGGLEQLSLCTTLCAHRGGQDCPAMGVRGGHVGFSLDPQARADGILRQRGLGEATSRRAFLPLRDHFHLIVEGMITPGPRRASTPSLAMPLVLCNRRLGIGDTRTPPGFHTLDGLCDRLGFLGLG